MRFDGTKRNVVLPNEYQNVVYNPRPNVPDYVQLWSDNSDVYDYDVIDLEANANEVIIHEVYERVGEGRYVVISDGRAQKLIKDGIIK